MAGRIEEYTAADLAADIEEVPYVEHELDLDDQRIRRDEQKEEAEDGGFMPSSQGSSSSEGSSWCSASDCSLSASSQGSNRQTDDDEANGPAAAQAQEQEPDVDYDSDADTAMETYEYGLEQDADPEAGFGSQEPASSQGQNQQYDVCGDSDSDTAMEVQPDDELAPPPSAQPAAQPDPAELPSVFTGFRLLRMAELHRRVMQPELSGWRADWYELAGILYDLDEVQTDFVRYLMDRLGTRASDNVLDPANEAWILHVAGIHWPLYLNSLTDTVEVDLAPGPS